LKPDGHIVGARRSKLKERRRISSRPEVDQDVSQAISRSCSEVYPISGKDHSDICPNKHKSIQIKYLSNRESSMDF
jgi:hypothetical protein